MDEVDKLHADEERRAKLRSVVGARLEEIEALIPKIITAADEMDLSDRLAEEDVFAYNDNVKEFRRLRALTNDLIAEHAVLEGLLDRPVARWVPRTALIVACASLAWQVIAALWHLK
ncbi:hypothetical protein D7X96_20335 [Corallococcus interemptor]|uniref:Uncharacterized protein n=1 Tax=Corallococcus interemptor TaxID=2316720 RepID=A0A3A8QKT7_9BACT|nr:hypothetical protein [Corallococcus interemptor]RKH66975.1 hypothetical protein D7X96_20335 [Corallococcus interemptor]